MAEANAIKPLVALLNEEDDNARKKAAGAIAALANANVENQVLFEKEKGISKLVGLLDPALHEEVNAEAAAALAVLSRDNKKNRGSRRGDEWSQPAREDTSERLAIFNAREGGSCECSLVALE